LWKGTSIDQSTIQVRKAKKKLKKTIQKGEDIVDVLNDLEVRRRSGTEGLRKMCNEGKGGTLYKRKKIVPSS